MRKKIYILLIYVLLLGCEDNKENINSKNYKRVLQNEKNNHLSYKIDRFYLKSLNGKIINIAVQNNYYNFKNTKNKIVLIYFFSTWCPPCIGEIPHLNSLMEKYRDKIDILGVLLYDNELKDKELNRFIKYQKIDFFISNNSEGNREFAEFIAKKLRLKPQFSIPLIIMFVGGKYFTHYEGAIPEEMIESDIKQAIIKLRGK